MDRTTFPARKTSKPRLNNVTGCTGLDAVNHNNYRRRILRGGNKDLPSVGWAETDSL